MEAFLRIFKKKNRRRSSRSSRKSVIQETPTVYNTAVSKWSEKLVQNFFSILSVKKSESSNYKKSEFDFKSHFRKIQKHYGIKMNGKYLLEIDITNESNFTRMYFPSEWFITQEYSLRQKACLRFSFYLKLMKRYGVLKKSWIVYELKMTNPKIINLILPILKKQQVGVKEAELCEMEIYEKYKDCIEEYENITANLFSPEVLKKRFFQNTVEAQKKIYEITGSIPKKMKVSVIISDPFDDDVEVPSIIRVFAKRFMSFGYFHSCIMIGPWVLHWNHQELVKPYPCHSKGAMFSFELLEKEVLEEIEIYKFIEPVIDKIVEWNLNYTYNASGRSKSSLLAPVCENSANCQHFVLDIIDCFKISTEKKSLEFGENIFVDRDRKFLWDALKKKLKSGNFENELVLEKDIFDDIYESFKEFNRVKIIEREFGELSVENDQVNIKYFIECMKMLESKKCIRKCKIVFNSHAEVDDFCIILREGGYRLDTKKPIISLLKSFDRAFWLRFYKEEKRTFDMTTPRGKVEFEKHQERISILMPRYDESGVNSTAICPFKEPCTGTFLAAQVDLTKIKKPEIITSGSGISTIKSDSGKKIGSKRKNSIKEYI